MGISSGIEFILLIDISTFAFTVSSFVIRQSFGIFADFSAWLRLTILPNYLYFTGLLAGVGA